MFAFLTRSVNDHLRHHCPQTRLQHQPAQSHGHTEPHRGHQQHGQVEARRNQTVCRARAGDPGVLILVYGPDLPCTGRRKMKTLQFYSEAAPVCATDPLHDHGQVTSPAGFCFLPTTPGMTHVTPF